MIINIEKEFCSEFTPPNKSKKHEKHKPAEAIFYFFFFLKENVFKNYRNNPFTQEGKATVLFE